jgi:hypothetical protein
MIWIDESLSYMACETTMKTSRGAMETVEVKEMMVIQLGIRDHLSSKCTSIWERWLIS